MIPKPCSSASQQASSFAGIGFLLLFFFTDAFFFRAPSLGSSPMVSLLGFRLLLHLFIIDALGLSVALRRILRPKSETKNGGAVIFKALLKMTHIFTHASKTVPSGFINSPGCAGLALISPTSSLTITLLVERADPLHHDGS